MIPSRSSRWVAIVLILGCHKAASDEEEAVSARVPVETTPVVTATLPDRIELVGRLRPVPGGSVLLSAPAAGVVRGIRVQVGSTVAAGTLILELDVPELGANARQLAASADLAALEAARVERLVSEGIAARKELERATAALASAKAASEAANRLAARSRLTAPIAGQVQRLLVQTGERVEAGAPVAEIVDPRALELVAVAPGAVLGRLKAAQAATIATEGGDTVTGSVRAIAPAVDSITNTGEVRIALPNGKRAFRPGAAATARVTVGTARDVLVVPKSALVLLGGAHGVFVVGPDSVAHARVVGTGVESGDRIEVRGQLAAGDLVVSLGGYGLADGMRVVPKPAAPRP